VRVRVCVCACVRVRVCVCVCVCVCVVRAVAPPFFGTGEVTPGAYFVTIKGKPGKGDVSSGLSLHLNRGRNRSNPWVGQPQPNACYKGLAATLGQRHEWILVPGATANDDVTVEPRAVARMAASVCMPPKKPVVDGYV
jgi:hypothetical protein